MPTTTTVPPKEVIIMDAEGQRLDGAVGTYDEGSDLVLICEAEGGTIISPSFFSFILLHLLLLLFVDCFLYDLC